MNAKKVILFFALVLIIISSFALFKQGTLWWDEAIYVGLADSLYEGLDYSFNKAGSAGEEFRAPAFPVMIAVSYFLFGHNDASAKIVVLASAVLFSAVIYFLGKKLYSEKIGAAGTLLAVSSPQFVIWSSKILTEVPALLLATLSLYGIYSIVEDNKTRLYPVVGALIAIAFLVRYPLALLAVFFVLWAIIRGKWRLFFTKHAVLGMIVFMAVIAPWAYQNNLTHGDAFWGLKQNTSIVNELHDGGWHEYAVQFLPNYLLLGGVFLGGLVYFLRKRDIQATFLALWFLLVFLSFTFIVGEKQIRYLFVALPSIALISANTIYIILNKMRKSAPFYAVIIAIIAIAGFAPAFAQVYGKKSVSVLEGAGEYLHENMPEGTVVLSRNIAQVHYYSGRPVVWLPLNGDYVLNFVNRYKASYIEVDNFGNIPAYALNYFDDNRYFALEYSKSDEVGFVKLYRYVYAR